VDGCLWVKPPPDKLWHGSGDLSDSSTHDWVGDGGALHSNLFTAEDEVTNPHTCYDARYMVTVEISIHANIAPGGERVHPVFQFDPGDGSGFDGAESLWSLPNTGDVSGDTLQFIMKSSCTRTLLLDPSETRTYKMRVGATAGAFCTIDLIKFNARMLGINSD
jgi:hypothetical protein